jgi:hypothetical protein
MSEASVAGQMQHMEEETPVELVTGKFGTDDKSWHGMFFFFPPHRIQHRTGDAFCSNNKLFKRVNSPPFQH